MKSLAHLAKQTVLLLSAAVLVFISSGGIALSGDFDSADRSAVNRGIEWLPSGEQCLVTQSLPSGDIYVVGDSIVNGARSYLQDVFSTNWSLPDENINAQDSRSVSVGASVIREDAEQVEKSVAVVVALGTNDGSSDISSHIRDITSTVNSINPSAKIFWVDIAVTTYDASLGNTAIYDVSETENYSVVPWFKEVFPSSNPTVSAELEDSLGYLSDGIHPSTEGYEKYAQTVYGSIASQQTTISASNIDIDDNVGKAYSFFIQKGFSDEQTAGILGNLAGESGLNPQNVQNSFTRNHGVEDGEHNPLDLWWWGEDDDGNRVRKDAGYGIAQWTHQSRKERFVALAQQLGPDEDGNIYGSLDNQLDLVWYELTGEPNVPGVSGGNYRHAYDDILSTSTIEESTISWVQLYERPNSLIQAERSGATYQDLVDLYKDDRIKHAQDIYDRYAGAFNGGVNCSGVVSSNVVATALLYSWPDEQTPSANPVNKPEYQAAVEEANSLNEYIGGGRFPGVDCGGFVTRVMRNSGHDPFYNSGGGTSKRYGGGNTYYQNIYLMENWRVVEVNSTADLQPGDVAMRRRATSGHTFMWVGDQPSFQHPVASAAYDSGSDGDLSDWRAPGAGHENPMDPTYTWYRRI